MKIFRSRFRPLCGLSLFSAIRWLTPLNLFLVACLGCFYLSFVFDHWSRWLRDKASDIASFYLILGIWIAWLLYWIITVAIDCKLHSSARQKHVSSLRKCESFIALNVTYGLIVYALQTFKYGLHLDTFPVYSVYIVYKYYQVIIIHHFIIEIAEEEETSSLMRNMTEEEMRDFRDGLNPEGLLSTEQKDLLTLQNIVVNLQYDNCSEVDVKYLTFDTSCPLGSGAYGSVYKGSLKNATGLESLVAVKTINPLKTDISYFKALLLELKVMSRLGSHNHVVQFLGACTTEIKQRKLLILLEFCSLGNLNNYLKSYSGLFVNLLQDGTLMDEFSYQSCQAEDEHINTKHLIRWSYEIALGMEFLGRKKVIHGDLAARNILLTGHKVAKITDFGLARQLYAYSIYVKKQNTPLPWRHMALESFLDMSFSPASDVWSYAVTLWEIFTLIKNPWEETHFNIGFVEQLKQGMRLSRPQFAPTDIYHLMLNCWKREPSARPHFKQIVDFFTHQYVDEIKTENFE